MLAHARLVALRAAGRRCCCWTRSPPISTPSAATALFDELVALGAQGWLTGTDAALFAPLGGRAQFLRVAAGLDRGGLNPLPGQTDER